MLNTLRFLTLYNLRRSALKALVVATLLAILPLSANADTVLNGNTFYAEDFQDLGTHCAHADVLFVRRNCLSGLLSGRQVQQGPWFKPVDPPSIQTTWFCKSDGLAVQDGL